MSNPYNCSEPGNCFVGYKDLRDNICNNLQNNHSYAIIGGRRCGKTSILMQIEKDLEKAAESDSSSNSSSSIIPRRFSVNELGAVSPAMLFETIFKLIVRDIDLQNLLAELSEYKSGYEYQIFKDNLDKISETLKQKYGPDWKIILLIDELDAAVSELPNDHFFQNLRHLDMESELKRHFRFIVTGAKGMAELILTGSPLNHLNNKFLRILSLEETEKLVQKGFSSYDLKSLYELTGGHPYLLQGILEIIWDTKNKEKSLWTEQNLNKAGKNFLKKNRNKLKRWFDNFSDAERSVYQCLASSPKGVANIAYIRSKTTFNSNDKIEDALQILSYNGFIDDSDEENPKIAGTLLKNYFLDEEFLAEVEKARVESKEDIQYSLDMKDPERPCKQRSISANYYPAQKIYLEERIGNPALFTGRRKELDSLLKWTEGIKEKTSKSKAIISRRKTGKSTVMERLFNIVFDKNDKVVPFYFEIKESRQWLGTFSKDFFCTFVCQYLAFKTRKPEYINYPDNYEKLIEIAQKEKLDYLSQYIRNFQYSEKEGHIDLLWDKARDAPRIIAGYNDECVLQMIDEFQFINRYICRDKECEKPITELAGSYLRTVEYKIAPLIVSGSWIGWLMDDLSKMLPGRLTNFIFESMPEYEAIEMVLNYSEILKIPITYESACIIAKLTEGNPFYISSFFLSEYPDKNFLTEDGILELLNFETLDKRGMIRTTWMEYISTAINKVNDINGKKIILYICKKKEVTRNDIKRDLELEIKDGELESRLKAFVNADIIDQGNSDFVYQAVKDNIFDKVFRGVYQQEIDGFDHKQIKNEYKELWRQLQGKYNQQQGKLSELLIIINLRYRAYKQNDLYISMMNNLPKDFSFVEYESVWRYTASPVHKKDFEIDVFARAPKDGRNKEYYTLIGEVKNRKAKFSLKEAQEFLTKALAVKNRENIKKAVIFVYSASGFNKNTISFFNENNIAWSQDGRFMQLSPHDTEN